jgi:hypothetical protein
VAKEGKPRAKTGRNTKTNSTSVQQAGNSGKAAEGPRLGNTPNYGRWVPLGTSESNVATALSSKSIRFQWSLKCR